MIFLNIEKDIFKRTDIDFKRLKTYGFKNNNNEYIYEKVFLNNKFKAIITINKDKIVTGKVIDLEINDEYLALRIEGQGEFVSKVREEYKSILSDIKKHCCDEKPFISEQANRMTKYIKEKYNNEPEFLWDKFKGCAIFRNSNNKKWYALITNIDLSKLENKTGEVEIINVKLEREKILDLLKEKGYYPAYHMNKEHWITILLDGTVPKQKICDLIDISYDLTSKR